MDVVSKRAGQTTVAGRLTAAAAKSGEEATMSVVAEKTVAGWLTAARSRSGVIAWYVELSATRKAF